MRKLLTLSLLLIVAATFSSGLLAQTKSTIFTTAHNIASLGGGCPACHTPHQSSAKGEVLLWATNFPTTATFGVYNTPTMNAVATDVGGNYSATNLPSGVKLYTVLCLSCHDGVTSTTVIAATAGSAIANPTNSDGLKNDHPVNVVYSATDTGLETVATVQALNSIKLYSDGTNQTVQCASCHNVHDNTNSHFLRVTNTATKAGLCTTCHK